MLRTLDAPAPVLVSLHFQARALRDASVLSVLLSIEVESHSKCVPASELCSTI